jgi:signal transduction histidine kinase
MARDDARHDGATPRPIASERSSEASDAVGVAASERSSAEESARLASVAEGSDAVGVAASERSSAAGDAGGDAAASVERRRGDIAERFVESLQSAGSPLVRDPATRRQMRAHVDRLLDDTIAILHGEQGGRDPLVAEPDRMSLEIGTDRARHGIRPAESVRAASVLFETVLMVVAAELTSSPDELTALALALERSSARRVGMAASTYFSSLLDQIHDSHAESYRRLARELHDDAAHTMAVALRDLDLYEIYRIADHGRAQVKLAAAKSHLQEAIDSVRALATQLRRSETGEGLQAALVRYLATADPTVATTATVTGDEAVVPLAVRDELFLVLREALGNALRHADPRTVTVEVQISRPRVDAVVTDDGQGFDPGAASATPDTAGTGLPSMAERAHRVGGTLDIASRPGHGTTVRCQIPLPRRYR